MYNRFTNIIYSIDFGLFYNYLSNYKQLIISIKSFNTML